MDGKAGKKSVVVVVSLKLIALVLVAIGARVF